MWVIEIATSSSTIRSSTAISSAAATISVRRASAWASRICSSSLVDDRVDALRRAEDVPQVGDPDAQLGELVDDLLALEAGQPLQLQLEDLAGLDLAEAEARDEAGVRLVGLAAARMSAITSSRWSRAIT